MSNENMSLLLEELTTRSQQNADASNISLQSTRLFSINPVTFEDLIELEMIQEMKRQRDSDDLVTYKKNTKNLGGEHFQRICGRYFFFRVEFIILKQLLIVFPILRYYFLSQPIFFCSTKFSVRSILVMCENYNV